MTAKDTYCSYCGTEFQTKVWPRTCFNCNNMAWRNPVPAGAVLVPVIDSSRADHRGLLLICRGENPAKGKLAFPGGHLEVGETWQEGSARELYEEVGLRIDPAELELFSVYSAETDKLIIFSRSKPRTWEEISGVWRTNEEVEYIALYNEPIELGFESHTDAMKKFFRPKF